MSVASSGSFVVVSSVRALSLVPRVRGRRVAWRRSSPVHSFLRVAVRPQRVFRPGFASSGALASGSSVVGAVRRVAPACGPLFSAHYIHNRTATAGPACGQQKLDRCGGTNREGI